ncbi:uncharacterized protein [Typha angustifolia]|uniref:uncharacterized protein isoform X2 n=1 Tax=Typha angustifolia TaxID=59011 RepID=UPI003C2B5FFA
MVSPTIVFNQLVILLLLLLLLSTAQSSPLSSSISSDQAALLAFREGIVADPQNALSNWNETTDVCQWNGIFCGKNPERVVKIILKSRSLQGTISPSLSNLSFLELLELSDNSLRGSIPVEIGALPRLELLGMKGNNIQHEIPESFGMLTRLRYVDLSNNQLSGNHLPVLQNLLLYSNQLTGSIPRSLSNCTRMEEIDLEDNFLVGILPSETLKHMTSLKILHLSNNNLSSDEQNTNLNVFFDALLNLTHLEELELAGNYLGGRLPSTVGLLGVNLSEIHLQNNLLHGAIPSSFSNLSKLMSLCLSNNYFDGSMPLELILLPNLQRLWIANNLLHGEIPSPPGVLNNLGLIDLSRNKLSGSIPPTLANLTQLRMLILDGNSLSGSIPSTLGNTKLELLDLSHNMLTGVIPSEVASLSSMAIYLNLSDNLLDGQIPMELSKMEMVRAIDLSSNNLNGAIPNNLGSCDVVELVNLSHNHLQGSIPESLGSLLSLQSLDLSYNYLSGEIPVTLQKSNSLRLFDLSFNNFSGPLPQGGLFDSLTVEFIKGNHFCGTLSGLPTCNPKKRSIIHSSKYLILLVGVTSVSAFLLTIICVVGYRSVRTGVIQRKDENLNEFSIEFSSSFPRITYRELAEATGGFEPRSLIGSGSFGHVYRGILGDGSVVAVKVLQLQSSNSTRSFNRECQVLKRIRHRNLMRIITACSLPDFKALVLPFMGNGSLDSHLHTEDNCLESSQLSLIERVNICSDVAEGLAYLHHHSPVQVIHCDLKPSNILLNDDMTALVSDFGISRLVMTIEEGNMAGEMATNSTANMLCGSIGYVAPEYGYGGKASTKGDVYSFGIVVLEMVTGKRPTDDMFKDGLRLQRWVKLQYQQQWEKAVDPSLMHHYWDQNLEIKNMWEVAIDELLELGLVCTQEDPSSRPTMLDAADDLDRIKRYLGGETATTFTSSRGEKEEMNVCIE